MIMDRYMLMDICSLAVFIYMIFDWLNNYKQMSTKRYKVSLTISYLGMLFSIFCLGYSIHEINYFYVSFKLMVVTYLFLALIFPVSIYNAMKVRIMNADYKKKYAKIALPSDYERWVKSKKFFFWGMLLAIAIVIFEAFFSLEGGNDSFMRQHWDGIVSRNYSDYAAGK